MAGRNMISGLDHIVLLVRSIDAACAAYQTLLGVAPAWRTGRDGVTTVLFQLGNTGLELMSADGESEAAGHVRRALDSGGEGLASLVFAVDDIDALHRRLERRALEPEAITSDSATYPLTGAQQSWRRTRANTARTHGIRLFFLQRESQIAPSEIVSPGPVTGLDHVVISTPDPERAAALYGARVGLEFSLDRSNPDWGQRLLFFRCGDLVVEISHRLKEGISDAPDRFYGLTWRTDDVDAMHARLSVAGLKVSELRQGRKAGTRVFTVKDGTCGVPTLILGPSGEGPSRIGPSTRANEKKIG
jgi:catechol 2,3-dioxygenase-like lactoylglutathione lyase family enzyme